MRYKAWWLTCACVMSAPAFALDAPPAIPSENTEQAEPAALPETEASPAEATVADAIVEPEVRVRLSKGTPVTVVLDQDLSTNESKVGDTFQVSVAQNVFDGEEIAIPQGTFGVGEVTFVTDNGGFGKPGIIAISLRYLEIDGKRFALDGRYREEGKNKNDETAATFFAVGIFAGFIKGKAGGIPMGRELKARTGEEIAYIRRAAAPAQPFPRETIPANTNAESDSAAGAGPGGGAAPRAGEPSNS